jgi:hypothetical protein
MLKSLTKAVVGVVVLPVAVAVDAATFPWIANEDRDASTPKVIDAIADNIADVINPDKED